MRKEYIILLLSITALIILFIGGQKLLNSMLPTDKILEIKKALVSFGITNPLTIAGIISQIWTESKFIPQSERDYSNTSNDRIREIFGFKVASLSDNDLTTLKKNPVKFFDLVYGGRYGNNYNGDGYKYRGRGLNQLTFKDNYLRYGNLIGLDLVNNPDLVNQFGVAVKVVCAFFSQGLKTINVTPKTNEQAAKIALQINAGTAKDINTPFYKGVLSKQMVVFSDILNTIKNV